MTDLTAQWKKGELEQGWYYVKVDNKLANDPVITECVSDYNFSGKCIPDFYEYDDDKIIEVLAPVPSYEEWQRIFHYAGKYEHEYTSCVMDYENLKEENQHLKELLRECRELFDELNYLNMVEKIDNAIGEKNNGN